MFNNRRVSTASEQVESKGFSDGLRKHMISVYNTMGIGLLLTAVTAYLVANTGLVAVFANLMVSILMLVGMLAFMFIGFNQSALEKRSLATLRLTFYSFSVFLGASFSSYMVVYTGASLARVFAITSAMFLGMSLYGYTTKRDLSGMRSLLIMGSIGLMIAIVVNIFLQSSMLQFVYSAIGVVIYLGMTAYDNQNIKRMYMQTQHDQVLSSKLAVFGALSLYMNFIMLFQFLMNLLSQR